MITHIMPELPLDYDQPDSLMGHLNRVDVPELVGREPSPDSRSRRGVLELFAGCGGFPVPPSGRTVDHAQQRAHR
jgi:hypothetical protein